MTRIPETLLRRAAWAPSVLLAAMVVVGLVLSFAGEPPAPRSGDGWDDTSARSDAAFGAVVLTFPLVGLLILRRHPRNAVGWLLQGIGFAWGLQAVGHNYVLFDLLVVPVPAPDVVAALGEGAWVPGVGLMGTFLLLLYPDGHLPSSRWRPVAWFCALTMAAAYVGVTLAPGALTAPVVLENPLGLSAAASTLQTLRLVSASLLPVCVVVCATALTRRFRGSRGVERLQLRWLATAGSAVAALYLVTMATGALVSAGVLGEERVVRATWFGLVEEVTIGSFVLVPLAIGVALLRYRLYDLDVVLNRTLVYGLLTAALAAVYLASVLVLQLVLSPLTDQSDLAVAASTLAVAALFRPARASIQAVVDGRFFRRRYDAARTLDDFAARLRHEVDLEAVGSDLSRTVRDTVAPAHVSLWVRSDP